MGSKGKDIRKPKKSTPEQRKAFQEVTANAGVGWWSNYENEDDGRDADTDDYKPMNPRSDCK